VRPGDGRAPGPLALDQGLPLATPGRGRDLYRHEAGAHPPGHARMHRRGNTCTPRWFAGLEALSLYPADLPGPCSRRPRRDLPRPRGRADEVPDHRRALPAVLTTARRNHPCGFVSRYGDRLPVWRLAEDSLRACGECVRRSYPRLWLPWYVLRLRRQRRLGTGRPRVFRPSGRNIRWKRNPTRRELPSRGSPTRQASPPEPIDQELRPQHSGSRARHITTQPVVAEPVRKPFGSRSSD
jgi:hypothetical protein